MLVYLVVLAFFIAFFAVVIPRINELFYLSRRDGDTLLVRGKISPSLYQGILDILKRGGVKNATIRGLKTASGLELLSTGLDDRIAQRLRNFVGTHPSHALRAGHRRTQLNLGQLLGIVWLAWLLHPRR